MRQTKKEIWNVILTKDGKETLNQNFKTLYEIAENLGMTYSQVSDYKNGRSNRFKTSIFVPDIQIKRIGITQKAFYNAKRIAKSLEQKV